MVQVVASTARVGHHRAGHPVEGRADERAEVERREEEAAAEAAADGDRRGQGLQQQGQEEHPHRRHAAVQELEHRPVPGGKDVRGHQGHGAEHDATHDRLQVGWQPAPAEQGLDQRDAAHDRDPDDGARQRQEQQGDDAVPVDREIGRELTDEAALDTDGSRHENPGDGRRDHRREAERRVGADDELKRVERPRERCPEGRADCTGRAGADEHAQVRAAHVEDAAEAGREAGPELRVTGFETDGGTEPVRQQGLRADDQAVDHGHVATVQGVGLDRIDRPPTAPLRQGPGAQPDAEAATDGHQRQPWTVEPVKDTERVVAEQEHVHERGGVRQPGGEQTPR